MADKAGNRIDVNLKLLQNQELKLLKDATEQFRQAAVTIENSLRSYSGQVAGYSGIAEQGGLTAGGVVMGRSRPSGPALDPSLTGHGGVNKNYGDDLLERRRAHVVEQHGRTAQYSFAPGLIEQDLEARIRTGNVGEMRSRDFFQYLSYFSGKKGYEQNAEGLMEVRNVPGSRMAARTSNISGAIAVGIPTAQSAMQFAQRVGRSSGMSYNLQAPFAQLGYDTSGIGGTDLGSGAWKERIRQSIGTKMHAAATMGWGTEQEQQLRESMLGIGINPGHGGKGGALAADLRDITKSTGLPSGQLVEMMQHTIRFDTKKAIEDLIKTMGGLSNAAKQANMTTNQFAEGMVALSSAITKKTGMSSAQSLKMASQYQAITGIPGGTAAGMLTNSRTIYTAMAQQGVSSPNQLSATALPNAQMSLMMSYLGASSAADLKANWKKGRHLENSFGTLTLTNPDLFGGMNEQDVGELINNTASGTAAMNDFTAGMDGKNLSSKRIDQVAKRLLKGSGGYKSWKSDYGDIKAGGGRDARNVSDMAQLKAIGKAMKKAGAAPTVTLGLTHEAAKLVKQLGGGDKAHSNKDSHSRSANPSSVWDSTKSGASSGEGAMDGLDVPGGGFAGAAVGGAVGLGKGLWNKDW